MKKADEPPCIHAYTHAFIFIYNHRLGGLSNSRGGVGCGGVGYG